MYTTFELEGASVICFFPVWQAGYIRIDGSVPSAERIQLVHRFQNDPETRVAILSIQAAGQVRANTSAYTLSFQMGFFLSRFSLTSLTLFYLL